MPMDPSDRADTYAATHPDTQVQEKPGYVLMPDGSYMTNAEWDQAHPTGWTWQQLAALALPLGLGAGSALLGGGSAAAGAGGTAAASGIPDLSVTTGLGAVPGATVGAGSAGLGAAPLASTSLAGVGTAPAALPASLTGAGGGTVAGTTASSKLLGGLGDLGTILGKQAQGNAQGQLAQGQLNNSANNSLVNLYRAQQNAQNQAAQTDLERQQFTTSNRGTNAKQALVAQLLGNYTPTNVSVPGITTAQFSGGLAGAMKNNPGLLSTLSTLGSQANDALTHPQPFTGGDIVKPPTLTPTPQVNTGGVEGGVANGLQLASAGGGLLSALKTLGWL